MGATGAVPRLGGREMRSPLTAGRRMLLPLIFEAFLTLGLVYAVGAVTLHLVPDLEGRFDLLLALSAALPLAASVTLARHTRRRFKGSLAQEVTLVSLLTIPDNGKPDEQRSTEPPNG